MTHRDKAKSILKHYFRQAVGAYWSADNDAEIDYFVDELILAVGESDVLEKSIDDWKSFFDNRVLGKPIGILVTEVGETPKWIEGSSVPEDPKTFLDEYSVFKYLVFSKNDGKYKFYGVWRK